MVALSRPASYPAGSRSVPILQLDLKAITMAALFSLSRIWPRVVHALHCREGFFSRSDPAAHRFVPMAVLLDESQAYKPEIADNLDVGRPQQAAILPTALAAQRSVHERQRLVPSGNSTSAAPAQQSDLAHACSRPRQEADAACSTRFGNADAFRVLPRATLAVVISGKLPEVCARLDRLAAQEERLLRAG